MKNTKITKIALIVLSVALLLGTVIGFTVNAAEATEYEILAKNVIYGDRTNVVFAVNATVEAANAGTVKVAYYWAEDGKESWKNATLLDTNDVNNLLDKTYPAFAIDGVALKELGNVVYATAYTGDAPAEDAKWVTYSAAEYFYSRLYKDGTVNATSGKEYNQKKLYESMLESGKWAQMVLDHNTDKLVDKYSYIFTTSELINFNGAKTAFGYGELSLTATSELAIAGWTLTNMDGVETTLETVLLTVDGIYKAEPIFGAHEHIDEDKDHVCESCGEVIDSCKDADENGVCDYCHTYRFGEGVVYNNAGFSTLIKDAGGTWVGGSTEYNEYLAGGTQGVGTTNILNANGVYMDVVNDPYSTSVENRVLRVATRMVSGKTSYIDVKVEKMSETADVFEFTFDYMADFQNYKSANFNMAYIMLWNTDDGKPTADTNNTLIRDTHRQFILRSEMASAADTSKFALDTTTMKTSKVEGAFSFSANDGSTEAVIDSHTWYKVKLIVADGVMYRYYSANGGDTWNLISQSSGTDGHYIYPSDLDNASIEIMSYNNTCRLYFDNISFVAVDEPSIELPTK